VDYIHYEGIPDERMLKDIFRIHEKIFGSSQELFYEMKTKPNLLVLLAYDEDRIVGYKIGYERKAKSFYSWIGGVDPNYRNRGIATELMKRQHEWCRRKGYQTVRTHTKNKWRDMLILNLRHGFDIIGTFTDEKGEPKIILEKRLNQRAIHYEKRAVTLFEEV
jgi:predicted GNAT superfamily acetyltransferase